MNGQQKRDQEPMSLVCICFTNRLEFTHSLIVESGDPFLRAQSCKVRYSIQMAISMRRPKTPVKIRQRHKGRVAYVFSRCYIMCVCGWPLMVETDLSRAAAGEVCGSRIYAMTRGQKLERSGHLPM